MAHDNDSEVTMLLKHRRSHGWLRVRNSRGVRKRSTSRRAVHRSMTSESDSTHRILSGNRPRRRRCQSPRRLQIWLRTVREISVVFCFAKAALLSRSERRLSDCNFSGGPYFCTDAQVDVRDILETVADRRSTIAGEVPGKQFLATLPGTLNLRRLRRLNKELIRRCI